MKLKKFNLALEASENFVYYFRPCLIDVRDIDISCFFTEAAIDVSCEIFENLLIRLVDCGVNLRNLSVYKGDTYLHAASILACRKGQ